MPSSSSSHAPSQTTSPSSSGERRGSKTSRAYTIPCRREERPPNRSPGPAEYNTPRLSVYKSNAPGYSMGGRTKEVPKKVVSPGPKYFPKLPTVGPRGYTFGTRTSAGPYIVPEDRR